MEAMNYGFINEIPTLDEQLCGYTANDVLSEDCDFEGYLPISEKQSNNVVKTASCVSFSALNCLETILKRKYNVEFNFSDRFTSVMSNTHKTNGNTFSRVGGSIMDNGIIEESICPSNPNLYKTVDDFYELNVDYVGSYGVSYGRLFRDMTLRERGRQFRENFEIQRRWIGWNGVKNEVLNEYLRYGPIQVSVYAWSQPLNGVYEYVRQDTNHAVMLFKMEKEGTKWRKYVYDSVGGQIRALGHDFYIGSALQYNITLKESLSPWIFAHMFKLKNGRLPEWAEWKNYSKTKLLPWDYAKV